MIQNNIHLCWLRSDQYPPNIFLFKHMEEELSSSKAMACYCSIAFNKTTKLGISSRVDTNGFI